MSKCTAEPVWAAEALNFTAGYTWEDGVTLGELVRFLKMSEDPRVSRATLYHEARALLSKIKEAG